jgi:hypothetical protein
MTSKVFHFGALHAPQEVRDRRLILDGGTSSGPMREAINPENTLVYVGVNGRELEEGLSYDNHLQAMVIADLCSEFLRQGVEPSRISANQSSILTPATRIFAKRIRFEISRM